MLCKQYTMPTRLWYQQGELLVRLHRPLLLHRMPRLARELFPGELLSL